MFDLTEVYSDGTVVEGTARQLKFVGGNAEQCAQKLLNKKYDKYRENDIAIEIPKDFYEKVKLELRSKEENIQKRIDHAQESGDTELCRKLEDRKAKITKTRENLKQSSVTEKEAIFARKHPNLSTAKLPV